MKLKGFRSSLKKVGCKGFADTVTQKGKVSENVLKCTEVFGEGFHRHGDLKGKRFSEVVLTSRVAFGDGFADTEI